MNTDTPPEPWETVEYDLTANMPYGHLLRGLITLYGEALYLIAPYVPFLAKSRLISRWAEAHNNEAQLVLDFLPPGEHASLKLDLSCHPPASWDQVEGFSAMSMGPPGRQ